MAMKTPGVYIKEKNAFPNSIVEVATAVPAFIGITERADDGGRTLVGKPVRITSMNEYRKYFGGAPKAVFDIKPVTDITKADFVGQKRKAAGAAPAAAGDGASADDGAADGAATATASDGADKKLESESVGFVVQQFGTNEYTIGTGAGAPKGNLHSRYVLFYSLMHFFQNGGGPCYIVAVGNYEKDVNKPISDVQPFLDGILSLVKEPEPTMVLIPDSVSMERSAWQQVQQNSLAHCGVKMRNRMALVDVYNGNMEPADCIGAFRNDIGSVGLNFGAAYYPWVNSSVVQPTDVGVCNLSKDARKALVEPMKVGVGVDQAAIDKEKDPKVKAKKEAIAKEIDRLLTIPEDAEAADMQSLEDTLRVLSPLYKKVVSEMQEKLNLLSPCAAMAGIYTMVDNTRGVWKAPANVSVSAVVSPVVNIDNDEQEDLNVTPQGKSINAIRSFIGEGTLVWGARTLDGNSLDWRYINVRRTMNMLEESIKLASKAYVFEPNDANTWVTMKSMIRNFLTGIWKRGGLAGAVPDDAFSVHVGLGETMTSEDILEGILKITVLVAISRPAEFIEITFQQQMQKS